MQTRTARPEFRAPEPCEFASVGWTDGVNVFSEGVIRQKLLPGRTLVAFALPYESGSP